MKLIPYGKQFIDKKDKKIVLNSLSNDLITTGPYVQKFEKELKKYFKSKFSYVCSSGTSAIHLALLSINVKEGDVVLMPAVNFIASYNMAKNLNLKIYLIDVDELSGQILPEKIIDCIKKNKLNKIKALIVMHHGGYPQNCENFYKLKKKYNFYIIEDACHALGSEYKYKKKIIRVGSCKHSDISTFSLHPVKTITTGEGGVITTNNSLIAKNIRLFRNHGLSRNKNCHWKYEVLKSGYNYRLSDINCALGLSQLKKINYILVSRKKIFEKYNKAFKDFNKNLKVPIYSEEIKPSFHLFLINIDFNNLKKNKDDFMKYLKKNNIFAQYHYIPIYKFKINNNKSLDFPGSEKYFKNTLSIPIYVGLKKKEQEKIIKVIKDYF